MIAVLRLGHRRIRDKRITTHVCLVARAFGADKVFISGEKDEKIKKSVQHAVEKFGGDFEIAICDKWKELIKNWSGVSVHLTMYGEQINNAIKNMPKNKDLLVIVGGEKVPGEVYKIVNFNIAVGSQPHSEVAALAIFLDRYLEGEWLKKDFAHAKLKIIPTKKGKQVVNSAT